MLGITVACFVALTCAFTSANGSILENQVFLLDTRETSQDLSFGSIFRKALKPKNMIDSDDQTLEGQISLVDNMNRNLVANTIRNMLESFRDVVINGNDDVPPLDPLVIDHLGPYVYTHTGIRITANVRNFRLEGLRWYVVNDVTFSLLRLAVGVRMTVPWLVLTGNYDATAFIGFISHRSQGTFRIFINRIDVDVDARLGTSIQGGHLLLRDLNIRLNVNDVQIQITGMTGSSVLNSLINNLVQGITREFINNEMENISEMISEALFDVINEILKDFTLDDLLS